MQLGACGSNTVCHPEPTNGHDRNLETKAMLKKHAIFCRSRQLSYRVQVDRHVRDLARSPRLSHMPADKGCPCFAQWRLVLSGRSSYVQGILKCVSNNRDVSTGAMSFLIQPALGDTT